MSGYLGRGWLTGAYLAAWQDLARPLAVQVVDKVALPYALGDIR